ncbi:MAG: glucose-6-phosphate 1-dehydrogenase [Firmicutes bacterium]|nr:glucose-6-phosphate 1-dehydrogenase [Bacillota bacterium]
MVTSREIVQFDEARAEYCLEVKADACAIVIFGASGDLTHRKLIPSLFNLFRRGLLPEHFFVLGCARAKMTDDSYRKNIEDILNRSENGAPAASAAFISHLFYLEIAYDEAAAYHHLAERLAELEKVQGTGGRRMFYLSTPPNLILPITRSLGQMGLAREIPGPGHWPHLVIEKPFGHDSVSAAVLTDALSEYWQESQIYRIDHYLGKETVQNILVLRFANIVFESVWNRQFIDHVQITVGESDGVGSRAQYYEQAGTLRDMFQNHMLQMLSLVAMEPPAEFTAERYREEKLKLLRAIRPFSRETLHDVAVRGQYTAGSSDEKSVPGYTQEAGVNPDSHVETTAALKVMIDNWRWEGVPFYLRSGKRWNRRVSEIAVVFRRVPHSMFGPMTPEQLTANTLVLKIQPAEGMGLTLEAKRPGAKNCISALSMDFDYRDVCHEASPDAYERLLLDCMASDQTLFVQKEEVALAWSILAPVMAAWQEPGGSSPLHSYPAGEFGPAASEELLRKDGRTWRRL